MADPKTLFTQQFWKLVVALAIASIVVAVISQQDLSKSNRPGAVVQAQGTPLLPEITFTPRPLEQRATAQPTATPTKPPPKATPKKTSTPSPTPAPVYHRVAPGEMPLSIAFEYGVEVEALMAANGLTDPSLLQVGHELLIPVKGAASPSPTPEPRSSPTPITTPVHHTVKAGDTLLAIALAYNTTVEAIQMANKLSSAHALKIGQELLIVPSNVKPGTPAVVHTITSGDTFAYLSFFYGSTIDDILVANPELDPDNLQIGQQVVIPVTTSPVNPKANPEQPRVTVVQAPQDSELSLQQQVVQAINGARNQVGLPPYQVDTDLIDLALVHSQDMLARGYFAHTTPEGVTLKERIYQKGLNVTYSGENLQRNTRPLDQTVAYAMNWWLSSGPHTANILNDHFNRIGVGVTEGPPGWYTYVLVFAER